MNVFDRDNQAKNLPAKIIAGVERLSTIYKSLMQDQSAAVGLSPLQIQILTFICFQDKESCTTTKISDELCMTKGTVSDSIRVLMKKEMITKIQSVSDSRSYMFVATKAGHNIIQELFSHTEELVNRLTGLGEQKVEDIWLGLATLLESFHSIKEIPSKMCFSCSHYHPLAVNGDFKCRLLQKTLKHSEMRIDCKEHEAA